MSTKTKTVKAETSSAKRGRPVVNNSARQAKLAARGWIDREGTSIESNQ